MGANVWPASLPAAAFRAPVEAYFAAAHALARTVLEIIARTLPHGPRVFDGFMAGVPAAPMRLLHYPPARQGGGGSRDECRIGASAHTDFGAVTLLLQDATGGLEVQDQASERWVGVPPRADAVVVNVGDMLAMWTRGAYKSSVHRVVNRSADRDRYSVVLFYDGNLDCPLAPLDGSGQGQKWPTVEEHMLKRIRASYVEPR
ncbi:Oxoglutarate/iron-dependent oxygenase [Macrophomina phaseolina MS6]|uniref:Oxoglutarate/iron-dependent oxygenase n=1 Tax=Macrophomina phaseolina (strain MS6) TaxID=1126212 RepID=K2RJT5_MACPH|nr:Oxoglutarate/iron-dependent oxygenase [Macrophomina phaseolina MS6]